MRIVLGLSPTPHPTDETEGRKHGEVEIERWATSKKEKKRGRERKERENIESGSFFFRHFSMPNVEWPFIEIADSGIGLSTAFFILTSPSKQDAYEYIKEGYDMRYCSAQP